MGEPEHARTPEVGSVDVESNVTASLRKENARSKGDDGVGGGGGESADFVPSFVARALLAVDDNDGLNGLSSKAYDEALAEHGYNEVIVKEKPVWLQFLSRYFGIVPLFITVAAVVSAAVETQCKQNTSE